MCKDVLRTRCIEVRDTFGNVAIPDNIIGNTVIENKISIRYREYSDESLIVVLKTSDGKIIEHTLKETVYKLNNEELYIGNLTVDIDGKIRVDRTISTFTLTTLYDDSEKAKNKAINIFEKSKLLGVCPIDEKGYIEGGLYEQVTISDLSNSFSGNVLHRR